MTAPVEAPPPARAAAEVVIDPDRVPITVAELDLVPDAPSTLRRAAGVPGDVPPGTVLALVRYRGRPLGVVQAEVEEDAEPVLTKVARQRFEGELHHQEREKPTSGEEPLISVVVATRERPELLARCLDALASLEYPSYEVVVVDNAPVTNATADLVRERRVRYVQEPQRGLAAAHNRGLAEALGEIVAFTDDDVVVDAGWLAALAAAFAEQPGTACVTGLILPARLDTRAQAMLEAHGGFAKGFSRRAFRLGDPPAGDPLFPFTAGRLGSGANMAFRAAPLRALGGFDPATGTGTPARGGDDLLAFFRALAAGHTLVYQPEAIVWHHHRERPEDLDAQAFGYGAGLGAYLTAAIAREPRMLPALLRRLPGGVRYAFTHTAARGASAPRASTPAGGSGRRGPLRGLAGGLRTMLGGAAARSVRAGSAPVGSAPVAPLASTGRADGSSPGASAWPARLSRLQRRGMLYGPVGYARSRLRVRGIPLPWEVHQDGR